MKISTIDPTTMTEQEISEEMTCLMDVIRFSRGKREKLERKINLHKLAERQIGTNRQHTFLCREKDILSKTEFADIEGLIRELLSVTFPHSKRWQELFDEHQVRKVRQREVEFEKEKNETRQFIQRLKITP